MFHTRRAAMAALLPLVIAGCAAPLPRHMAEPVAAAVQPVQLHIGIKQAELYAEFERSNIAAGAAACGAVPGIGILVAAVCGGTLGAIDATVNAERAKVAEGKVRPLKDAVVDVNVDSLVSQAITKSLRETPRMKLAGTSVTKTVEDKAYAQAYRASNANSVMFVNVDYHLSSDFSTLEVSVRGLVFPRSASARTAAGQSAVPDERAEVLQLREAAYHGDLFYRAVLPKPADTADGNIELWKADNAALLRAALTDGSSHIARLLAQDVQQVPGTDRPALGKADAGKGMTGDLLANEAGGQLIRVGPNMLVFKTSARPGVPVAAR